MTTLRLLPDLEDALRQIPGIKAASVVTSPSAQPTEIHVLATTSKAPKQIVRDIQSLAMARYDLDIDHRIVSVVQFDEPADTAAADATDASGTPGGADQAEAEVTPPRPVVTGITIHRGGDTATATITVTLAGGSFEGSATGSASSNARPRLVATATLEALRELLGTPAEVEHAAVVAVGGRSVAVTVLTLTVPRHGEQFVTGSALVRGDDADATARSVLDALNRRLTG